MLVKPAHVPWFTDTCCVNRIPDVIQAPSGLVDITRLGPPKYVSSLKGDLFAEKDMWKAHILGTVVQKFTAKVFKRSFYEINTVNQQILACVNFPAQENLANLARTVQCIFAKLSCSQIHWVGDTSGTTGLTAVVPLSNFAEFCKEINGNDLMEMLLLFEKRFKILINA